MEIERDPGTRATLARLLVAIAIVSLVAAACGGGGGSAGGDSDPTRDACTSYLRAYDAQDAAAMSAAIDEMLRLARDAEEADPSVSALAPMVSAVLLSMGPPPWQQLQYGLLKDTCTAFIASG